MALKQNQKLRQKNVGEKKTYLNSEKVVCIATAPSLFSIFLPVNYYIENCIFFVINP